MADIIICGVVLIAVGFAVRSIIKKKGGCNCGGGCDGCCNCSKNK